MTPIPASRASAGATNMPNPSDSVTSSDNRSSGELRAAMSAIAHAPSITLLGRDPITDCPSPHEAVERAVDALLNAGYRLVSDDDAAIRTIAQAVAAVDGWTIAWPGDGQQLEPMLTRYLDQARAAVRALREGA